VRALLGAALGETTGAHVSLLKSTAFRASCISLLASNMRLTLACRTSASRSPRFLCLRQKLAALVVMPHCGVVSPSVPHGKEIAEVLPCQCVPPQSTAISHKARRVSALDQRNRPHRDCELHQLPRRDCCLDDVLVEALEPLGLVLGNSISVHEVSEEVCKETAASSVARRGRGPALWPWPSRGHPGGCSRSDGGCVV